MSNGIFKFVHINMKHLLYKEKLQKGPLLTDYLFSIKALSHYNVLANVCRRMKNISSTLAYAEIQFKNRTKPLSELMQSVRETNIERMSNL